MKPVLRNALVFFICICAYQTVQAQTPDVAQVLRDVQATYASLHSYSATGEVVSGISTDGSSAILAAAGPQEFRTTFTLKLARPQMYKIIWEQGTTFMSMRGAVWSDGESRFLVVPGITSQPADTETAIAAATGISGGVAHTIPSIFFDLSGNELATVLKVSTMAPTESIDGEECYVVKAHTEQSDRTFWISKGSKLIRQVMTVTSGTGAPPEISDADLKKALETMGQKPTDEAIRAFRAQMASGLEMMKSIKSSYRIEKQREIKTNDPMSTSDFREKTDGK